jgi:hypothetical protein
MQKPAEAHGIARSQAQSRASQAAVVLAFFVLFFLYVWLRLEPAVEYYSKGTVFFLNRSFLHRFLAYPGGAVEYGAAFLAQLNYQSWLGALVFTVLGALVFLAARRLCQQAAGRAPLFFCLAPSLVLLAWRGRYDGQTLAAILALVLGLSAALSYAAVSRRPVWWRWPMGWCTGAVLYYMAGLWPFLLFQFFAGWFEASQRRKWLSVAGLVIPGLLIPVAWAGLPLPGKALNPWGIGLPLLFACLAFLWLPAGLVVLAQFPQQGPPAENAAPRPAQKKGERSKRPPERWWRRVWVKPAFTLVSFLAGCALVWGLLDGRRKALAQIELCAALGQHERLLAVAQQLKTLPPATEVRVHLALYHTGRLDEDLFAFANRGRGNLLPGLELGLDACRPQGETLLELGQVNEAEHQAQEVLEFEGDRPDMLRLLARVNVLKDRPKAAAVFLNLLRQVPFQRAWAATCLAELKHNPRLAGDRELDLARSWMVTTDLPHDELPAETMLRQLLHSNPHNQMAFEYLLAYYLLTGDLKQLAQHLGQLDDFGYRAIPRPVEEALLLGQKLQGLQFDLHGREIRPETVRRFQRFCDALAGRARQAPAGLLALAPDFGDTFWYYYYSRLAQPKGS